MSLLNRLTAMLGLTSADQSPPGYVAILKVRRDFRIPANFERQNIPGLAGCQVLADDTGETTLITIWQSRDHFEMGQVQLCLTLEGIDPGSTFERQGRQGQFWHKERKKTLTEKVFSWSFLVSALAVFGVLQGLATYFDSFSSWTFAFPRLGVVGSGSALELVEQTEGKHTLQVRNDATSGESRIEITRAYLEPVQPGKDKRAKEKDRIDLVVPSSTIFQTVDHGATVDLSIELPRLPAGEYRLFVDATNTCGWFWWLCQFGVFEVEAKKVIVSPRIAVLKPSKLEIGKRTGDTMTTFYDVQIVPALDHDGVKCQATLVHPKVRIASYLGQKKGSAEQMQFPDDSLDHSGLRWEMPAGKAKTPMRASIILKGPADTNWHDVLSKIEFPIPQFSAKE